jgi:polynucleotide 5'-kinase involved in rRNA processing
VLAGAFIGYDLTIDEVVARETLGTVSIIDLDIKQNPISPSASITYNP